MSERASEQGLNIYTEAIQRFVRQFDPTEALALGNTAAIKAELRQLDRQGRIEISPVILIQCEGKAHRSALLCLKSRLRQAAVTVGISSIGLAVEGEADIGFFCD